jgi:uncharacterized membrane protein YozB (DUF420 family)
MGNISLVFQIIILFLLLVGLPLIRRRKGSVDNKNLIRHGYFTALALILHTVLIISVMAPSFLTEGLTELGEFSAFSSIMFWSHIVLGTAAEVLGVVIVGLWLSRGPSKLTCFKYKKWMTPLFIIWVISIINGALIHLLGLM